jgi:mannose-6-phosphate isomerase-like protein (cupin superfamily)
MLKGHATPQDSFLSGKVLRWSLAVIQGAPPAGAPELKRLLLPQGELAQFYSAEEGVRYIAYAELVPNGVRGNHFHDVKEEFNYVISGEILLAIEDIESKERDQVRVQAGDLIFIPTRIAHAIKTLKAGVAVEFSKVRFDPADVQRFMLI